MGMDEVYRFFYFHVGRLSQYLNDDSILNSMNEIIADQTILRELEDQVAEVNFFRKKHWESTTELGLFRLIQFEV